MRAVVGIMLALAGCYSDEHVVFPQLPAQLTPADRLALFDRLRPAGQIDETTCGRTGCATAKLLSIVFHDGTRVDDAEDLLPLVRADSISAQAGMRAARARTSRHHWALGIPVMLGAGIATIAAGSAAHSTAVEEGGVVVLLVGPVVCWVASIIENTHARSAAREAFMHYEQDLAQRLQICVNGLALVPCEGGVGTQPPPAIPDPALRELRQLPR